MPQGSRMSAKITKIEGHTPDWRVTLEDGRTLHLFMEKGEAILSLLPGRNPLCAMMHPDFYTPINWKDACHALARMGYTFGHRLTVKEVPA